MNHCHQAEAAARMHAREELAARAHYVARAAIDAALAGDSATTEKWLTELNECFARMRQAKGERHDK
jgi:hypothetical protein